MILWNETGTPYMLNLKKTDKRVWTKSDVPLGAIKRDKVPDRPIFVPNWFAIELGAGTRLFLYVDWKRDQI